MEMNELLRQKREGILRIVASHRTRNVRVFGSFARGEARSDSDIDLLVEMQPDCSFLDHVALIQDLEDLMGRKVDVVNEKALHWYIRDRVLKEAVAL